MRTVRKYSKKKRGELEDLLVLNILAYGEL